MIAALQHIEGDVAVSVTARSPIVVLLLNAGGVWVQFLSEEYIIVLATLLTTVRCVPAVDGGFTASAAICTAWVGVRPIETSTVT